MADDINKDDDGGSGPSTLDKILGTLSPLYGLATGQGLLGGLGGLAGMRAMSDPRKKKKPGEPPVPEGPEMKMAKGGRVKGKTSGPPFGKPKNRLKAPNPFGKKPKGTGTMAPPFGKKKFASGGSVRGDGCASRGKTKGRMR